MSANVVPGVRRLIRAGANVGAQVDGAYRPKLQARAVALSFHNERIGKTLRVLDSIDLEVGAGELLAIVGPSGCGKSTFLGVVDGLIRADSGDILIDGARVVKPGPDRAMVFQHDSLFPWRTVLGNVTYGLDIRRAGSRADRKRKALDLIELVGLGGFADHFPHELSGGMRQRVNIARALALEPEVLLLDEPFAALDAQTREFMQLELVGILSRARTTAVFITHQIDEAIFLADRVAVFTARPARVKEVVSVRLPERGDLEAKRTPAFRELETHIWRSIVEESRGFRAHAGDVA